MKNRFNPILTMCLSVALLTSCDKDMGSMEVPFQPYVLSLGITSAGTTTYYVVTAEDLMSSETINAYAKGLEQNGYRDYQKAEGTAIQYLGIWENAKSLYMRYVTRKHLMTTNDSQIIHF